MRCAASLVPLAACVVIALAAAACRASAQPAPAVHIRILNAQTNKPVTDERLNVALHEHQLGYALMPTDKTGTIAVNPGSATTLRVLANMYADCRSRAELYTNYVLTTIVQNGITGGNLCSGAHPSPKPGELLLFVIPKTWVPTMGQPPNTTLPHSDENPHAPR